MPQKFLNPSYPTQTCATKTYSKCLRNYPGIHNPGFICKSVFYCTINVFIYLFFYMIRPSISFQRDV